MLNFKISQVRTVLGLAVILFISKVQVVKGESDNFN